MDTTGTPRFPAKVYATGIEPDVRFSFANERTYLAWLRTSIALIASSVALEVLAVGLHPGLRTMAAALLAVAGIATPIVAWFDWMRAERALRHGEPLRASMLLLPLGCTVFLAGLLVVAGAIRP